MGRYYRSPKVTSTRRASTSAAADHREDPVVPLYVLPTENVIREGAWADVPRKRGHAATSKPKAVKRKRAPWKSR